MQELTGSDFYPTTDRSEPTRPLRCLVDSMDLKDKVALITGGTRMGNAVAEALADRGSSVVVAYNRSKKAAEETVRKVRRLGRRGLAVRVDLRREKDIQGLILKVKKEFGRLDILINMASVYERANFKGLGSRAWQENMDANLRSVYLLAIRAAGLMKARLQGRIVNFSDWVSASGRPRYKDFLPYYVSKKGIIGLTEALALELAPRILVNAIAPGPIMSPPNLSARENREVVRATPLARWGGPEEIAKTVSFLVETDFVTGECIRVDGGRHLF